MGLAPRAGVPGDSEGAWVAPGAISSLPLVLSPPWPCCQAGATGAVPHPWHPCPGHTRAVCGSSAPPGVPDLPCLKPRSS